MCNTVCSKAACAYETMLAILIVDCKCPYAASIFLYLSQRGRLRSLRISAVGQVLSQTSGTLRVPKRQGDGSLSCSEGNAGTVERGTVPFFCCFERGHYWVSGSGTLAKYDSNWNLIAENTNPFEGYTLEVNHIGDIDVYNNELYLGVEYFMDGEGKNIQVAVYDGDDLKLKRVFPFRHDTGQLECSGIAVDPDSHTVYMTSWIDDESSGYLYSDNKETGRVSLEKTYDDVIQQGEIEGLTFDEDHEQFLLLYNRGARIVAGMP